MTVDPTDPETLDDQPDATESTEFDVEAPEADAAEQQTDVAPNGDDPLVSIESYSANEADRIEQARVVELDEDDYR
ncbi:hypothetical protein [Streptomyces poonensis]|uniref:Uncharacterized protein n=1 Tax=Streptomyces poonensis TaxID=68255 RepID=A0A918P7G4_9ACTN|nr:hypothetical protein [Streptomyces poonensis]GGY89787.1 hypothetical protein GCM10010365_04970 [Streptomyces poonensis]GLJ88066.1 hypothetical protein GCM10017589_06660 [Streptomyces poonensis]